MGDRYINSLNYSYGFTGVYVYQNYQITHFIYVQLPNKSYGGGGSSIIGKNIQTSGWDTDGKKDMKQYKMKLRTMVFHARAMRSKS